ncbi:hypothetical protein MASR1M60_21410 [Rhodocyclaceae bacterium]
MNGTSGTFNLDMRPAASEAIAQIVEDLWQKGYDLKKAGMGWVVREPLGADKIELASDHELLAFVGGGYKLPFRVPENCPSSPPQNEARSRAASIAATPPPPRQSSPRSAARTPAPAPALVLPEPFGLRQLMQETWQAFVPQQFRRWLLFSLIGLFVLIAVSESRRWQDGGLSAVPDAVPIVQALPVEVAPMPGTAIPAQRDAAELRTTPPLLSNALRIGDPPQSSVPLSVLPVKTSKPVNPQDLTVFADQCAIRLMERFASGPLALMVNAQARRATVCYTVDGNTHCPYVSQGRATLNYLDVESNPPLVYACDIDVSANAVGNLRLIESNPDIVRFLTSGGAS